MNGIHRDYGDVENDHTKPGSFHYTPGSSNGQYNIHVIFQT